MKDGAERKLLICLVLSGEPRLKSYIDVLIRTPKGVAFGDRVKFGLKGEIVSASAKLSTSNGSDSITQKKAHHIESNINGVIKDI